MPDMNMVLGRARYAGGTIGLVLGYLDAPPAPEPVTAHGTTVLAGVSGTGLVLYANRNPRRVSTRSTQVHQTARAALQALDMPSQQAAHHPGGHDLPMQQAQAREITPDQPIGQTGQVRGERAQVHEQATPREVARAQVHQITLRVRTHAAQAHQIADHLQALASQPHQLARLTHTGGVQALQIADRLQALALQLHQRARAAGRGLDQPFEQARPVPPGKEVWPPVPTGPGFEPHVPDLNLVFACPPYQPGAPVVLIFGHECGAELPPAFVIVPVRSRYVTYNTIQLRRVAGDIAINASSVDLAIDHKSWTWSWSAGLERSALALLAPEMGDLVEMELSINGVPYRLHAEDPERQRKFPQTRVSVSGRGLACELDGDDVVQQYFSAAADRTAQQLANEALTVNGVGIGWDVEWGLTDWLVPGGVWSHQGTHISAVSAIAAAAGGYVQPHPTARTLRVLPGYPAAPWDWGDLTPDIELPAAPVTLENIRWHKKPAYDRVFVSGEGRSTIWDVTRGGTAGLIESPMVVDQLATHVDAARQRGIAVLGDTGRQALVTLSLPVLQETGLILPGKLVRYVDGPTTRVGLVRSCAIEWRRPTLRQRINLETHI